MKKRLKNPYRKGANLERKAVNNHIVNGAIFAGRFSGSKCKGKLKVDVVALYGPSNWDTGQLVLEQYKKGKGSYKKEKTKFNKIKLPVLLDIKRNFIQVK